MSNRTKLQIGARLYFLFGTNRFLKMFLFLTLLIQSLKTSLYRYSSINAHWWPEADWTWIFASLTSNEEPLSLKNK